MYCQSEEIKQILTPLLVPFWNNSTNVFFELSDSEHYLMEVSILRGFYDYWKKFNDLLEVPHRIENQAFDCDDFAYLMRAQIGIFTKRNLNIWSSICFGITWGKFQHVGGRLHAMNWYLTDRKELYFIEPQDFKSYTLDNCIPNSLTLLIS